MNYEYVYILTNPAMPEWIKIGKAKNIKSRLKGLNCTSVPLPFFCYAYLKVPADSVFLVESNIHKLIGFSNDKEKEFFRMSPEKAYNYFEIVKSFNPTFELVKFPDLETKAEKKKRSSTTFGLLGIPVGAVLAFSPDRSVTCTVENDKNSVMYKNEKTTLSAIACDLTKNSVNGFDFFVWPDSEYPDETLWERRLRLGF